MAGPALCKVRGPVDRSCSARRELPSPSLEGLAEWPLSVLVWRHLLPKLPADPQTSSNPHAFAHAVPAPERPSYPPRLALGESVHCQDLKRVFFFLSKSPFSHSSAPWPGKAEVPGPYLMPRSVWGSKSPGVCIAPYLCVHLQTVPLTPLGSSGPATSVPGAWHHLQPGTRWWPGSWVYALQSEPSQKERLLCAPQRGGSDPNQQECPAPPPRASMLAFCPENFRPGCGDTCSLMGTQRWLEGGPKGPPDFTLQPPLLVETSTRPPGRGKEST